MQLYFEGVKGDYQSYQLGVPPGTKKSKRDLIEVYLYPGSCQIKWNCVRPIKTYDSVSLMPHKISYIK